VGEVAPTIWMLQSAVALALLIACANFAGLLLARGIPRQREIAVRRAMGAMRSQIARLLLQSLLVALWAAYWVAWPGGRLPCSSRAVRLPRAESRRTEPSFPRLRHRRSPASPPAPFHLLFRARAQPNDIEVRAGSAPLTVGQRAALALTVCRTTTSRQTFRSTQGSPKGL
jgi:hypothetical protein